MANMIIQEGERMKLTEKDIEHVASLARLNLAPEQKTKMTNELANIINFADKLNELDTTGVEPTAHILDISNVFRKDEVRPSFDREDIIANAPTHEDGCVKVPKVVE
jgi:aspartyl-tRNA(Asn)/glutamyl-tRNA(Gln) amidotransferase subunit C